MSVWIAVIHGLMKKQRKWFARTVPQNLKLIQVEKETTAKNITLL